MHRNPLGHCLRQPSSFLHLIKTQTLPDTLKSQERMNFCLQAHFFFHPFLLFMHFGKKQRMSFFFFFYRSKCYFSFINKQLKDFITRVQTESTAMHIYGRNKQTNPPKVYISSGCKYTQGKTEDTHEDI